MARILEEPIDLTEVLEAVVPVVRRRVADREQANDVCQETVTRVLEASSRLEPRALVPYAVTVAKNLATDGDRQRGRDQRNQHRMLDRRSDDGPEDVVLAREQRSLVEAALANLDVDDRDALVDHVIDGLDTAAMAKRRNVSPGAVATHLARVRAKMRVEYVLAAHNVDLPTDQCRPVLVSLSAADARRQARLGAGDHLDACSVCAGLARPLVERDRTLLGIAPVAAPAAIWAVVRGAVVRHPVASGGAGAAAALVAAAILVSGPSGSVASRSTAPPRPDISTAPPVTAAGGGSSTAPPITGSTGSAPTGSSPAPASPSDLTIGGRPVLSLVRGGGLRTSIGQQVVANGTLVGEVPAPFGFWLGITTSQRVWVQLIDIGDQPKQVTPGTHITFTGTLVAHGPGFASTMGLTGPSTAELDNIGAHIEVARGQINVSP